MSDHVFKGGEDGSAEKRLAQITIEQAPDSVFWVDPKARIIRVNETACRVHGYSREKMLSLTVFDLTREYDVRSWPGFWDKLRTEGSVHFESHHIRESGEDFPVDVSVFYVKDNVRECCACFIRDISERREKERQLQEAYAEIEQLKDRLAAENTYLREELETHGPGESGIVTGDKEFKRLLVLVERVAPTDSADALRILMIGCMQAGRRTVRSPRKAQ